jgi:hypothetical protein
MFTYRCPACGKHHSVDKEFEQTFESKCLRCSAFISVTPELIHQSQSAGRPARSLRVSEESITKSPEDSAVRVAARSGSAVEAEAEEPALDAPSLPDEPEPEAEPRKNGRAKSKDQTKDKDEKSRKKKPDKRAKQQQEEEDEEPEEEAAPEPKRGTPPAQSPPKAKGPRPRWKIIAPVAAVVLVLFVAVGFLIFGGKKPETKRGARSSPAKAAPKTTKAPPPAKVEKKEEPPIKTPDTPQLVVSAAKLSAELAADADRANIKYAGKILEVSGLFSKIDKKEGLRPPARPHAVFATTGAPVSCDLQDSSPPAAAWNRLKPEKPFTIRGKYEKNGYLSGCFLMPEYTSTADSRYKDRTIEVTGRIARMDDPTPAKPFPSLVFEGETNSLLEVRCLFRITDEAEVKKIQLGSLLTIQGKCSGRVTIEGTSFIRLDNSKLVYTSAPPENIPRVEVGRLLREYDEDVRPDYLPPPGQEEQLETVWTIRQLVKEYSANPEAFAKKYRNHILRVRGQIQRVPLRHETFVNLISGDTDLSFPIECHFDRVSLEAIRQRREREYRIRGLFTGPIKKDQLRLDNCQLDMPRAVRQVVTAEFLPHKSGRSFTVDVVTFGTLIKRKIGDLTQREVHVQGKDGVTEIVVTHIGPLTGKSLFEEGVQEKWVQDNKVRIRTPASTGIYLRRLNAGFVEIGTPHPGQNGKTEITWLPMLKLEAQVGDKWKWESSDSVREYVLEKFDEFQGQPSAVIREIHTLSADVLHPIETLHVYAKDFGEVERRQWRQLDQRGNKKLLSEMKWVNKPPPAPGNIKSGDKSAVSPPRKASKPRP